MFWGGSKSLPGVESVHESVVSSLGVSGVNTGEVAPLACRDSRATFKAADGGEFGD